MRILQFRKFIRIHWVLLALLLTAAAFFFKTEKTVTAQLGEHSFSAPVTWANDLTREQGWAPEHPRLLADINGDHMDDIVGFGNAGVYRSLATGNGALGPVEFVVADFGYDQGWRNDKHVRLLADVNGDTRKDIVGFGTHGVWVSLSMSTNGDFSAPFFAVGDFGTFAV